MANKTAHELAEAFSYLTKDEVTGLKKLVKLLPKNPIIVNLGAGAGTSGLAFLETREDAFVYTIDIRADSPLGSLKSEINALEDADIDYKKRHKQILGNSAEVGRAWEHGEIDMVFVDADHSEKGIRGDIKAWLPKIKVMGIIAFDDYITKGGNTPRWIAVEKAVDELVRPFYIEILHIDSLVAFEVS